MRKPELAFVVANIYDTVCDDARWDDVLAHLAADQNAAAGVLFLYDKRTGHVPIFHKYNIPAQMGQEYDQHIARVDERIAFMSTTADRRASYDYLHTDESQIDRSAYYDWLNRWIGTRYYAGYTVENSRAAICILAMQRTRKAGHAQVRDIELLDQLGPHIERAIAIRKKIDGMTLQASVGAAALDRADYGVIACDGEGRIVHASTVAQKLMAERDGIGDPAGRLDALLPDDRQALRTALASPTGGGPLRIRRDPPKAGLQVTVVPVSPQHRLFGVIQPTRLVLIVDPESPLDLSHGALRRAFGLTRMEARLADVLLAGRTLAECATALGIAQGTAKLHLHHLLAKTGTSRQAELIRLLLRSRAVLRAP